MVTIQLNWTTDRGDWGNYLNHIKLQQAEVAKFLGVSDVTMSQLVKKMTDGQGLTASTQDQYRWKRAVTYVKLRAAETKEAQS
ncbi:hypothetical protein [Lacticaseibacillus absianus]|uniref:hypothetical protein n=1 Tax=Lacticaseibacillus absianus TaxID=2729623 RepID=UPI0015CDB3F2|nr:hypothetical protein [Lacticaseibacillus absianus]